MPNLNKKEKIIYFTILMKLYILKKFKNKNYIKLFNNRIFYTNFNDVFNRFVEIFINGSYYFNTNKDNPLIIDCGASFGLSTLFFKRMYPKSRIICFEPSKFAYLLLKKNILTNRFRNVELYNLGLFDKEKIVNLYYTTPGSGSSSIFKKSNKDENREKIKLIRLSKFIRENKIRNIDFLKIDVEGSETNIIKDIKNELKIINSIAIEFHYDVNNKINSLSKILHILESNNFIININSYRRPYELSKKYDLMIYGEKNEDYKKVF